VIPSADTDQGTVSAFVIVMVGSLILLAGLVHDGSRLVAAQVEASDRAGAAARIGAQRLRGVRADSVEIDPSAAREAVRSHLAAHGTNGEVRATPESVEVTVRVRVPFVLLTLVGLSGRDVEASRTAVVKRG
jgi:hypothetical protein